MVIVTGASRSIVAWERMWCP